MTFLQISWLSVLPTSNNMVPFWSAHNIQTFSSDLFKRCDNEETFSQRDPVNFCDVYGLC